jgi:hypothetical protein
MSADLTHEQFHMVTEQVFNITQLPVDVVQVQAWLDTLDPVFWGSWTHVGLAYKYLEEYR